MIYCIANFDLMLPVQDEVRTGTIAAGLEGGILVVEGNPAENISAPETFARSSAMASLSIARA